MTQSNPPTIEIPQADSGSSALVDQVIDWLMAQSLKTTDIETLFEGCCDRLYASGMPLSRVHIAYRTLHPLISGVGLTWRRGEAINVVRFPHHHGQEPESWLKSPHYHMIERRIPMMRRRLIGPEALIDFPVLEEFRDAGGSDYLAFLFSFSEGTQDGLISSWLTDREEGFSDAEVQSIIRVQQRFAVACKIVTRGEIARNVMTTYLGPDAGLRVLDGQIQRGDGEHIHAAVWFSDLRGSTAMAEKLAPQDYIATLNSFFDAVGGAVLAKHGEILGFIGDAVLAIFPIRKGQSTAARACRRALAAAQLSAQRIKKLNNVRMAAGEDAIAYGLGLHLGDVTFGNIGVDERLAFSVIGPTVNEVARLEALTKKVGRPVVVSELFKNALANGAGWEALGDHKVAGVERALKVFAPVAKTSS
ncbi:MAG: adenylate/guanylate cyclase domain-containing protein [Alphaproteobacteria bacterium]|nr:adenylate/guanylate cyclase domain-containing protein [Alphaproteobacteria bacterium]